MARYRNKAGTALRGSPRNVRIGMGSGRKVARHRAQQKKGKRG